MSIVRKQCVYKFTRLRAVCAATARLLFTFTEWAKFYPHREGAKLRPEGTSPEARRAESGEWGSWGGDNKPPPHQLGGLGSAVSSHSERGSFEIWCNFRLKSHYRNAL